MNELTSTTWMRPAGALLLCVTQASVPASAQQNTVYTYDALGRLVRAQDADPYRSTDAAYAYDPAGNRTNVTVTNNGPTVPNGNFENPDVGGQGYAYRPPAAWLTFRSGAGLAANGSVWGFPQPWSGNQVAFLQAAATDGGELELKAVNLVVGKHYRVTFAAAQRPGYAANELKVYVDGVSVWQAMPASAASFGPNATQSFLAQFTTATIRFAAMPTAGDSGSGIDSVGVQQID